ncbi:MAG TPA: D-alanine--D-alanine ligase [Sutterella sp.]|nr:D-alanine--D-alanine ligase [Sutterella sp.]
MDKNETAELARKAGKVVLIAGGYSSEREISLMSGKGVYDALVASGVDVTRFDPQNQHLSEIERGHFDRAFNCLHGRYGEDGAIQGVLEYLGIPYTGSGVLTSAITIDKEITKSFWKANGLPLAKGMLVAGPEDAPKVIEALGGDLVVKPAREGSSIGLFKLKDATPEALADAIRKAQLLDRRVLVEERVYGRELTVAILGQGEGARALPIVEIIAPEGDYDYQNKYFTTKVVYDCPAKLDDAVTQAVQEACVKAYRVIGAKGWARIDVLLRDDGSFVLLEINTAPGMTSHSLVPLAAKASGMTYEELVLKVVLEASLENK